jgi:hypothetical protein
MPTPAQLAVAAVVAASHVHCTSKGSFDAFSGTVLVAGFLGMHALRADGPAMRWSGNLCRNSQVQSRSDHRRSLQILINVSLNQL